MRKIFHMATAFVAAFWLVSCAAPSEEERTPSGTQSPVNVNSPGGDSRKNGQCFDTFPAAAREGQIAEV